MKRILVTARSFGQSDDTPIRLLESYGYEVVKLNNSNPLHAEVLQKELTDFDAIIAGLDTINRAVIENSPRLKVISRYGVGYDKVDLVAAEKHGVAVTITPDINNNSVADLVFALMLTAARHVPIIDRMAKAGDFGRVIGVEVWKKTLGIIGLGRIGRAVAERAKGFSMNIMCYDIFRDEDFIKRHDIKYYELDEIFTDADFITLHVPLNNQTRNLIDMPQLKKMKKDAVLINTSRGGIINESTLYTALCDGIIGAAALDVTEKEPPIGSPLLRLDNCIFTSHIGGYTKEAVTRMGKLAAQNVIEILETGKCVNQII